VEVGEWTTDSEERRFGAATAKGLAPTQCTFSIPDRSTGELACLVTCGAATDDDDDQDGKATKYPTVPEDGAESDNSEAPMATTAPTNKEALESAEQPTISPTSLAFNSTTKA